MVFLFAAACLAALTLLFAFYAYRTAFYSPKKGRAGVDDPLKGDQYAQVAENISRISHIMEKVPFEAVSIESFDGLKLYGRYYHVSDGAPVELLFHGYRSHAFRDCSGGHALSRKMGFNALVVDQRAHGNSEGQTISFGINERRDVLSWIQYINGKFGADIPILLSGLSMGAATVLMSAGLDLPDNVCCIIADSPFSSPMGIIEKVCADMHYPVRICRPFVSLGARIFGGFRISETSAMDAVRNAKIPILLIHGEADNFVPCAMSHEIAQNCPSGADVQTFPGAGHGLCYMTDPKRYEKVVWEFLSAIPALKGTISPSFVTQLFEN